MNKSIENKSVDMKKSFFPKINVTLKTSDFDIAYSNKIMLDMNKYKYENGDFKIANSALDKLVTLAIYDKWLMLHFIDIKELFINSPNPIKDLINKFLGVFISYGDYVICKNKLIFFKFDNKNYIEKIYNLKKDFTKPLKKSQRKIFHGNLFIPFEKLSKYLQKNNISNKFSHNVNPNRYKACIYFDFIYESICMKIFYKIYKNQYSEPPEDQNIYNSRYVKNSLKYYKDTYGFYW